MRERPRCSQHIRRGHVLKVSITLIANYLDDLAADAALKLVKWIALATARVLTEEASKQGISMNRLALRRRTHAGRAGRARLRERDAI